MAEERYERAEDAVADALEALDSSRDAELDQWLRGAIARRASAFAAEPARAMTAQQVRDALHRRS